MVVKADINNNEYGLSITKRKVCKCALTFVPLVFPRDELNQIKL